MPAYDALFAPLPFKGLTLPNRIVMAPMTRSYSPAQVPGEDVAGYYRRRAEGGVGLIITEGTTLRDQASTFDGRVPKIDGEPSLEGWARVVEAVHGAGGLIMPQLWHVGAVRRAERTDHPNVTSKSPSGLFRPGKAQGEAMDRGTIEDTISDYARAAADARRVGFDGVEIHAAHGYLIDQFFWEGTNQRDDLYGGGLIERTRFAQDVVRAVRAATGPDYPIILRFSQWKQQDYTAKLAQTPDELGAFLAVLAEAGVDAFHCSTRRYWEPEFEGSDLNLAGWAKTLTGLPSITVGSIGLDTDFITTYGDTPGSAPSRIDDLVARLERGEFDLAAVGRALIANPDWPRMVRDGDMAGLKAYTKDLLGALD
ncbi:MAG: NADH:flavin oxidoreductase [Alphaproteobacteria bacterium]